MFVIKDDLSGNDIPHVCRFCNDAACVAACSMNALTQTVHGWLVLDNGDCTSCGACILACPYDALRLDPSSQQPLACDGCGGRPTCVAACVTCALESAS
ncbi:4Fe-4S dicluster domain-containing protein [Candidatus Bipolaricaulota bacterium]